MNEKTHSIPTQSSLGSSSVLRKPKIVVIDSGAGGLSIVVEILNTIPYIEVFYIADTAYFPYGEMPRSKLIDRLDFLVSRALEQFNPDLFVLACNTASTIGLQYLREKYSSNFVGVVPAVKPASECTQTGKLAILATRNTVTTDYIKDLVKTFALDKTVFYLGATELVNIAEKYIAGQAVKTKDIENILLSLIKKSGSKNIHHCDTLVLACTHFPLIKDSIASAFHSAINTIENNIENKHPKSQEQTIARRNVMTQNRNLVVLDSGKAIAKRILSVLVSEGLYCLLKEETIPISRHITIVTSRKEAPTNPKQYEDLARDTTRDTTRDSNQPSSAATPVSLGYERYLESIFKDSLNIKAALTLT